MKSRKSAAGQAGSCTSGGSRGNRRKGRPETSRGHDAADGHAAAGSGRTRVADSLDGESSSIAAAVTHLPPPGLHRLNRTEYANAIRDLLALEVDATKFLPSDDSTRGFDNIAGALTMSPALMEAYLSAAGKISRLAIGDVSAPTQAVFDVPAGHGAELPHRRAAVRHARRHADQVPVPGRRRVLVQGEGRHGLLPGGARAASRASSSKSRSTASG